MKDVVNGIRKRRTAIACALGLGMAAAIGCSGIFGRGQGEGPSPGAPPGDAAACQAAGLVWRSGRKTNYTSYPEPGSEECIAYSGCKYEGLFAACEGKRSEDWVRAHNIAAFFPGFGSMRLHDLCIRRGDRSMVVTVYDTCGDGDCNGCCTRNQGSAEALVDLEHYTNARFGLADGPIEWADLGPTRSAGCDAPGR